MIVLRGSCLVKHVTVTWKGFECCFLLLVATWGRLVRRYMGCAFSVWLPRQGVCLCHAHTHAGQQASRGEFLCAGEQRAYRVKVRAQDLTGQPLTLTLTDWRARIFQHEFDHLQVPPCVPLFN